MMRSFPWSVGAALLLAHAPFVSAAGQRPHGAPASVAQAGAAKTVRPDGFEYEVQADLERAFRRQGAERPSFSSIVGSGPNGTTLHYNANGRQMKRGEMVVVDIGASFDGYVSGGT